MVCLGGYRRRSTSLMTRAHQDSSRRQRLQRLHVRRRPGLPVFLVDFCCRRVPLWDSPSRLTEVQCSGNRFLHVQASATESEAVTAERGRKPGPNLDAAGSSCVSALPRRTKHCIVASSAKSLTAAVQCVEGRRAKELCAPKQMLFYKDKRRKRNMAVLSLSSAARRGRHPPLRSCSKDSVLSPV